PARQCSTPPKPSPAFIRSSATAYFDNPGNPQLRWITEMPFINGRFYMNPAYGRAAERARGSEAISEQDNPQDEELGDHWVTINGRHVLIQEEPQRQPHRNPKQFSGDATYYNLPGKKTASGAGFDPNKMAAAMTPEKAKLGQTVT